MGEMEGIEEVIEAVREKIDVDEDDLEEIDDTLLVKIHNDSFKKRYCQGYEAR